MGFKSRQAEVNKNIGNNAPTGSVDLDVGRRCRGGNPFQSRASRLCRKRMDLCVFQILNFGMPK